MRNRCLAILWIIALLTLAPSAQREGGRSSGSGQFVGVWSGTWDGSGAGGGFELTLERSTDDALAARVSVTGEPTYKATLKTVSFEGGKMTGRYDFPPDDQAEVILTATFEDKAATGTWSLREKSTGNEAASGGWKVSRK
jgi:hypothetical protein